MKNSMYKKGIRIFTIIIFAVVLELLVFNFYAMNMLLSPNLEIDRTYNLSVMDKINWETDGNRFISNPDPILIISNVDTIVKKVKITVLADRPIDNVVLFYTNNQSPNFSEDTLIVDSEQLVKSTSFTLNEKVNAVRIDLGDEAGLTLNDITVVINPFEFHFSYSRVIAILLMYLTIVGLSALQKVPSYQIEAGEH